MTSEIEDLENTLGYDPMPKRRVGRPRVRQKKLVCKNGHPFVGDNLICRPNGKRVCKACDKVSKQKWRDKNPTYQAKYNAERYAEKAGEVRLRFHWDGKEGRVVGPDLARLMKTDWIIAADFLKDVIFMAEGYYKEVLRAKHTNKGADHGG